MSGLRVLWEGRPCLVCYKGGEALFGWRFILVRLTNREITILLLSLIPKSLNQSSYLLNFQNNLISTKPSYILTF